MKRRPRSAAPPGKVRVIGGRLRGSRLGVPRVPGLRPTPQRLRQTLFDWLAPVIDGASVLDVFAGSGALGVEALSRGARRALFLERDPRQAEAIAADLERLGQDAGEVRCVDALAALALPPPMAFDIAFVDPPFDSGLWTPTTALLASGGWLSPQAWVYVEAGRGNDWTAPEHWQLHRQRDAGDVRGTLFRVATPRA